MKFKFTRLILLILGISTLLVLWDIRSGVKDLGPFQRAGLIEISPGQLRHLNILDSLCGYPFTEDCHVRSNGLGDTLIVSKKEDAIRFWYSLNRSHIKDLEHTEAETLPARSSYGTNSWNGMPVRDMAFIRNTEPDLKELRWVKTDKAMSLRKIKVDEWEVTFFNGLTLTDSANRLIAEVRSNSRSEKSATITSRDSTITLLIEWGE